MFDMFTAYWLIGVAYFIVEMIHGGLASLGNVLKEETQPLPPGIIPFLALILGVLLLAVGAMVALFWPLMMLGDYLRGELFRRKRWED